MIRYDFSGQTAIVTGGTRGIGRAISEKFLRAGGRVIATYAGNESAAQDFRNANSSFSALLETVKCDASDYDQVEAFFKAFDQRYPSGFEILVNNSGIRKDAVMAMMSLQDWQQVMNVNLNGTFNMCKFGVLSMMRRRYGRIVNITSPCADFGFAGQANYAASKAGQIGLTRSLSKEVATRGITVNCVSPGFIGTDLIKDLPDKLRDQYLSQIPLKRFGSPDEAACSVLYLASRESAYITGSVLEVTGGL